jgi:uncharacterized protein YdiU (UPF0061 family)
MKDKIIDSGLTFDNSYAQQLPGFYAEYAGDRAPEPSIVKLNKPLAISLGFDLDTLQEQDIAAMLSGGMEVLGSAPLAQAYAGHQFGGFSPQLGDGRALLLGEVIDVDGCRKDIQLKGSGRTVFSRGGDGKAALGPVLREYLLAEAMHSLAVPTTRALAALTTGENVMRNKRLPGAVLARVATSHVRIGTFQYFAARGEANRVKTLADYCISRHYPELVDSENPYLGLLSDVCEKHAFLVAKWMSIGFVHGVMNTDNMTISGETIDYGPCAFLDQYDPSTVFSSIDQQGRYAYDKQPEMAQWNLARLAETLLPLIDTDGNKAMALATTAINDFTTVYQQHWLILMTAKLGLTDTQAEDLALVTDLLNLMKVHKVDFTQLFNALSRVLKEESATAKTFFPVDSAFDQWLSRWVQSIDRNSCSKDETIKSMALVNPVYIPRNHQVEAALVAAQEHADFKTFEKLLKIVTQPFEKRPGLAEFESPAPRGLSRYITCCGT